MGSNYVKKNPRRLETDVLGDQCFFWFRSHPDAYQSFLQIKINKEFFSLLESDEVFSGIRTQYLSPLPELKDGHTFFQNNIQDILLVLGLYALPYCYAGANGARVLVKSKRITDEPQKRLTETAQFVVNVCRSGAYEEYGSGYLEAFKVRMMHAAARYYTKKEIADEMPVNQEDMLATMLAFSIVMVRGLRRIGVPVSAKESLDYLRLWGWVGTLLGINPSYIPGSLSLASLEDQGIQKREFRKSSEGILLTRSLTDFFKNSAGSRQFNFVALMHYLLGDVLSDILELDNASRPFGLMVGNGLRFRNAIQSFSKKNFEIVLKEVQTNLASSKSELQS
ncbi:MAG: oxygenase MpaB family protein [Marinoscillum sp.]